MFKIFASAEKISGMGRGTSSMSPVTWLLPWRRSGIILRMVASLQTDKGTDRLKQRSGSDPLVQSRKGDSQSHLRFLSWKPRYKETKFRVECVRIYNILYTPIRNGFRRNPEILRKILTSTDLHKICRRFRRASAEWFRALPSTTLVRYITCQTI